MVLKPLFVLWFPSLSITNLPHAEIFQLHLCWNVASERLLPRYLDERMRLLQPSALHSSLSLSHSQALLCPDHDLKAVWTMIQYNIASVKHDYHLVEWRYHYFHWAKCRRWTHTRLPSPLAGYQSTWSGRYRWVLLQYIWTSLPWHQYPMRLSTGTTSSYVPTKTWHTKIWAN